MSEQRLLKFLTLIGKLKRTKRTGWVLRNIKDPESVSDHMYRMSIMSMVIGKHDTLRRDRCIKLCLVHDMAECIVGDLTPMDKVTKHEKHDRENKAMKDLMDLIDDKELAVEIYNLHLEYEAQSTPEAVFVKDLDRLDMILQAHEYEQESNSSGSLQEFFDSTKDKFKTDEVKSLVNELNKTRDGKK